MRRGRKHHGGRGAVYALIAFFGALMCIAFFSLKFLLFVVALLFIILGLFLIRL